MKPLLIGDVDCACAHVISQQEKGDPPPAESPCTAKKTRDGTMCLAQNWLQHAMGLGSGKETSVYGDEAENAYNRAKMLAELAGVPTCPITQFTAEFPITVFFDKYVGEKTGQILHESYRAPQEGGQ